MVGRYRPGADLHKTKLDMLKWLNRVGLLMIFISSFMIIVPFLQIELCQSQVPELDSQGVGYRHCFYLSSRLSIVLLLFGNVLVVVSYVLRKLLKRGVT